MSEDNTGYRTFPPQIDNPSRAKTLSEIEFKTLKLTKMQDAPSLYKGHQGTTIWYSGKDGFILQIKLENKPSIIVRSICTFTPSMGMDRIDGEFAEDIEEYFLHKELGYESQRLKIFQGKDSVSIEEYLKIRGIIK